jgi:hypothetical protein
VLQYRIGYGMPFDLDQIENSRISRNLNIWPHLNFMGKHVLYLLLPCCMPTNLRFWNENNWIAPKYRFFEKLLLYDETLEKMHPITPGHSSLHASTIRPIPTI